MSKLFELLSCLLKKHAKFPFIYKLIASTTLLSLIAFTSCSMDSSFMNFYFNNELEVPSVQITLEWNPNTEPDLAGYRIYYGLNSGSYNSIIDVGNLTAFTIIGLEPGQTYYIAATAYNETGMESDYSEEVIYEIPYEI